MDHAIGAAEWAARESYGKLLAWLSWQWRDVCAAEDALSEAFAAALLHWPQTGVPDSPEAWLMTVAKRNLLMNARRNKLAEDPRVTVLFNDLSHERGMNSGFPDHRLRLLLVCAHPAIDSSMHSALMLQLVFGIDAARIANIFLRSPSALGKRLVRAKSKIRDAHIPFIEPESADLRPRIDSVLESIYGLYTINGQSACGPEQDDLADEAVYLAQLLAQCLPDDAEALGLLALIGFREARRNAQVDLEGVYVPLKEQDTRLWNADQIVRAEEVLSRAAKLRNIGRYQLEAAIQSAHMKSVYDGVPRWREISKLYEFLLSIGETVGAKIGYAFASSNCSGNFQAGLTVLASLDRDQVIAHQPWWATRAALLALAGHSALAHEAYLRASALTPDEPTKKWLRVQASKL
jgi:RNA polymerase sigma-70 factor (ECF subfamily)